MKLPYGDRVQGAQIEEKLVSYALNIDHDDGKHKAKLFEARLGICLSNRKMLIDALVDIAENHHVLLEKESPYGKKYIIDFTLNTSQGSSIVRSVWIIHTGTKNPLLTTVYPLSKS